jgi:hypothetical protein
MESLKLLILHAVANWNRSPVFADGVTEEVKGIRVPTIVDERPNNVRVVFKVDDRPDVRPAVEDDLAGTNDFNVDIKLVQSYAHAGTLA